jgi:hypothetical protein
MAGGTKVNRSPYLWESAALDPESSDGTSGKIPICKCGIGGLALIPMNEQLGKPEFLGDKCSERSWRWAKEGRQTGLIIIDR